MPETLIKVDLTQSAYENDMIHNRWHPTSDGGVGRPGDEFIIETYDWTVVSSRTMIPPTTCATSIFPIVHFCPVPIGVKGAEPAIFWWSICSSRPDEGKPVGL